MSMMNKKHHTTTPRLRFPEFRTAPAWKVKKLSGVIKIVTPPQKLPSSQYFESGSIPIVDQSQNQIAGWTDNQDALIKKNLPLVIFGDHTCVIKIMTKPFAQGADGIKIFGGTEKVITHFLFQQLQFKSPQMSGYKRHFSTLKEQDVFFPDKESGEQTKIADCLSSIDELITEQERKIELLREHKKGLMQQLFPASGESMPRLRFPEFRTAPAWEIKALGEVCQFQRGLTYKNSDEVEESSNCVLRANNVSLETGKLDLSELKFISDSIEIPTSKKIKKNGFLICMSSGSKSHLGKVALIREDLNFAFGGFMGLMMPCKELMSAFLHCFLKSEAYSEFIMNLAAGTNINNLKWSQLSGLSIPLPTLAEQQKVGNCLSSIDELITEQECKIELLREHKKGLMQQLFPSADEVTR